MKTRAPVNLLKDMDINEISLVVAPMNPGADILFTKGKTDWRQAIVGDVAVGKARDTSHEARDKTGKWTSAAVGMIGGKQNSYRRQIAQAFTDKARAIAHGTVANTLSAVKTTRHTGTNPVIGGGVQFSFEHRLKETRGEYGSVVPGARVTSSVQIRPEHLGAHPTDTPNKAQRALHALHRVVGGVFSRPPLPPFGGGKVTSTLRAGLNAGDLARTASGLMSGAAVAPTSTDTLASGWGWRPPTLQGRLSNEIRGKAPPGSNRIDERNNHIPLANTHTAMTAGGWAHYTQYGHFIPTSSPDIQDHVEKVHAELDAKSPADRAEFKRQHTSTAEEHKGKEGGYFTHAGDYVPPVRADNPDAQFTIQRNIEAKYQNERSRKGSSVVPTPATQPQPGLRERLFGEKTPGGGRDQEYDTGTPEQRRAALSDFNQDRRKSLFPSRPGLFQTTYDEHIVKRLPPGPHRPSLRWDLATEPHFARRNNG